MAKTKRPGSGRTKGSFSFVMLPLQALNDKLSDKSTPVKVSRLWAQELGFQNLNSAPAASLTQSIEGQTPTTKVGVTEVEL